MKRTFMIFLAIWSAIITANAQRKDERKAEIIYIKIVHPPALGLKINKIAFGPVTGDCADEIIDAIKSDFVSNNIEVIDRENLKTILAEHNFTLSGNIDQTSAAAIGKILGPSALMFIKITRCVTQIDHLTDQVVRFKPDYTKYYIPKYITRTRTFLKGSIQAVDLTTGKIFTAKTFDYSPEKQNESLDGIPEAPSEFDIKDLALHNAVNYIHNLFLSWTERSPQYYFDDKDYNLKGAYTLMESGNLESAYQLSLKNLEDCKGDPKAKDKNKAHAYYNLGISYVTRSEYDKALECFREVEKLNPGDIVTIAINMCNKAKSLMTEMQQVEEKASLDVQKSQAETNKAIQADQAATLSNSDIIDLTQKKLPSSLIIQKIKTSKCKFDTSTNALLALTKAGVAEDIIMLMMEKK